MSEPKLLSDVLDTWQPADELTLLKEVVEQKLMDAQLTPGLIVEFTPEEADYAGAFFEDALSFEDAYESSIDILGPLEPPLPITPTEPSSLP
ncbi:MAG: hypothetical protein ACRCYV_09515 [Aeromonas sp.]